MRTLARGAPAWTITAVLGSVYLIASPPSPDLAAAAYRSHLFSKLGFALWDNSWYAGHHLPAYSLLAPGLGAAIGPQLLAALSMVAAAALFAALIRGRFSARAERIGACWFALGASVGLLSARVPFDLGLAVGLGAAVLAQRRRWSACALTSFLCTIASPVAGAFLALAFLAWALAGPARARPLALTALALAPIVLLALAFPEGGTQPFAGSAFYPALAGVLIIVAAIPFKYPALRIGVVLYALALIGSYVVPSAVGGNVDRLGALAAGPVAALVLAGSVVRRRRLLLAALAAPLLYWQANAPVTDFAAAVEDPGVNASYYRPLLQELLALGIGYGHRPARVEIVPTAVHWEARWMAPHVMLARGWERQLDQLRNGLFYASRAPTPAEYRAWLQLEGVSYVFLPSGASLDYSGTAEARLIGSAAVSGAGGFLSERWHGPHWRGFEVLGAQPLAQPPAKLAAVTPQSFTLLVPAPGSYTVKLHFSPYWKLASGHGCVARSASGDWTDVRAARAGPQQVVISFSLARVLARGPRCA